MKCSVVLVVLGLWSAAVMAGPEALSPEEAAVKISWRDAADYVGQDCIVFGKVIRAKTIPTWCFLNFHDDYRSTFTVAIPKDAFANFPQPPEQMYANQQISVLGRVKMYKGKPEIVVANPKQITVGATLPVASAESPPARPARPRAFDGTCKVATFNVLNLFDDHDDPYRGDEGTRTKPREELLRVAETIRRLDADVLALQEIESRGYLERFVKVAIPDLGYEHVVLLEGNNHRGIDVALLSRLPVGPVTSHRHLRLKDPAGRTMRFQRDLLRVAIEPPGLDPFDVFVVHLKSKSGGESPQTLATRMAETTRIRGLFDEMLAADPQARFLICGDFNDQLDSKPVQTVIGTGQTALSVFVDDLPSDSEVTYNKEPHLAMIDFIFTSPAMGQQYRKGSYRILPGSVSSSGSDHNPVVATFELK